MLRSAFFACVLLVCLGSAQAQILIGQTTALTGPVAPSVKEQNDGVNLYLESINAKGGVNGQKIEIISLDDASQAKKAAENAQQLIETKNVLAMFLTRGTPQTEALVPMLEKHGVPLIAPSTGAMVFHQPVNKLIFNVRATYQREAERAIAHLASIGLTRIAVVHVSDSFGTDGLIGAQKGLSAAKLTGLIEKVERFKPDYAPAAQKIVKADIQAVMLIAAGTGVVEGVQAIRAAGSKAQFVTLSNNAATGFIKDLGDNARGVIVSQVFPSERSDAYPLVKEARAFAKAHDMAEISPSTLEGFAAAKVLVEGLRRAGPAPTREKLTAALESIRKFDLGGLEISYAPDDHTGLDFADLSIIGLNGKFRR